jgi:hypothetical protein
VEKVSVCRGDSMDGEEIKEPKMREIQEDEVVEEIGRESSWGCVILKWCEVGALATFPYRHLKCARIQEPKRTTFQRMRSQLHF